MRARLIPYLRSIAGVVAASLATKALEGVLGPSIALLFFPAIFLPAMYGGYGPAILATVLSTLSLAFFFIPPKNSFVLGADDAIRLGVFAGIACATAWLSTARRRAEQAERQSMILIAARSQELAVREERLRVSRDLHDGVLQALTGIRLELQNVATDAAADPPIHDRLLAAERALAIEQRELRRLIDGLRPDPALADSSGTLVATLRATASRLAVEWKTPVTVRVTPDDLVLPEPLDQSVRLMLHEAIVNALQHAHPSRVAVSLEHAGMELRMSVVDDGRGFPFQGRMNHDALRDRNVGPASLRDRVTSLKGQMAIDSNARGSRVDLIVPFDPT